MHNTWLSSSPLSVLLEPSQQSAHPCGVASLLLLRRVFFFESLFLPLTPMLLSRLRAWHSMTACQRATCSPLSAHTRLPIAAGIVRSFDRDPVIGQARVSTRGLDQDIEITLPPRHHAALRCFSSRSLSLEEQVYLDTLKQMIELAGQEDTSRTLVACTAVCNDSSHAVSPVCAHGCSGAHPSRPQTFTGVNFAMHTIANVKAGGRRLRGLLKGCAEQNTLGTVAAHGISYVSVSKLLLVSSDAMGIRDERQGVSPRQTRGALFPCAECWDHILSVAHMRKECGLPPLGFLTLLPRSERARIDVIQHFDTILRSSASPPIVVTLITP